jgi:hypothetical protein
MKNNPQNYENDVVRFYDDDVVVLYDAFPKVSIFFLSSRGVV